MPISAYFNNIWKIFENKWFMDMLDEQVDHTSTVLKHTTNLPMGTNGASLAFRISLEPWSSSYEERETSELVDIVIEESSWKRFSMRFCNQNQLE